MLKIFKDHVCKTSILDDFGFYDNHEKIMQEKEIKASVYSGEGVCDYQSSFCNEPSSVFTCEPENQGNPASVF